ncbi:MAG TPA: hypothetical protein VEB21_03500, partial [Terriglobales bacterium]|nr:hypothetical protein [Terriglobales bacterium]
AATSPKIQLYPTLVHEKQNTQPIPKLTAVKSTIVATCGWPATAVHCSSISLDQLEARLARLTWGQP